MKLEKIEQYQKLRALISDLKNELCIISEFKYPINRIVEDLKNEYVSLNPADGDGYLEAIKGIGGAVKGLEKTEEYLKMINEELSLSIRDLEMAIEWGLPKSSESLVEGV